MKYILEVVSVGHGLYHMRILWLWVMILFMSFTIVFISRCDRDVQYLKVKFDQEMAIGALLETSALLRGYSLRDKDAGRMFGGYRKIKSNPFYILASMFSGQSIFPAGDYDYSIVFPICAKNEPGFKDMLEDLRNPKRVFENLGTDFVPQPRHSREYYKAREYFFGNLDVVRKVDIIFKKDCIGMFYLHDDDIVIEKTFIDVPVSSSIHNKTLKGD